MTTATTAPTHKVLPPSSSTARTGLSSVRSETHTFFNAHSIVKATSEQRFWPQRLLPWLARLALSVAVVEATWKLPSAVMASRDCMCTSHWSENAPESVFPFLSKRQRYRKEFFKSLMPSIFKEMFLVQSYLEIKVAWFSENFFLVSCPYVHFCVVLFFLFFGMLELYCICSTCGCVQS